MKHTQYTLGNYLNAALGILPARAEREHLPAPLPAKSRVSLYVNKKISDFSFFICFERSLCVILGRFETSKQQVLRCFDDYNLPGKVNDQKDHVTRWRSSCKIMQGDTAGFFVMERFVCMKN